ncbi:nuclear transport factor 2 family protein [Amycolatopsis sp. WGS_07]|uniref:nuclear transport factor 2 family protein n=1 Tax=Amycolatopsis sp. WGS_07 TaxID=3076764 RepID=UPI003872F4C9
MADALTATDFSVVDRMFGAIEKGDMDELRTCFAPGARAWQNYNEKDLTVDRVIAILGRLCALSTVRTFEDQRVTAVGSQLFRQHTLTAMLRSGRQLRLPVMMRVEVDSDGLVARLEEYYDSRATDVLAEKPK